MSFLLEPFIIFLLLLVGVGGGIIAGMGGPGGIPVIIGLNLLLALSPPVAAATASGIFLVASIVATGLYWHSDGIDWRLAALIGIPAIVGAHVGTRISTGLTGQAFDQLLGVVLLLAAIGLLYRQYRIDRDDADVGVELRGRTLTAVIAVAGGLIGTIAGSTGFGGPVLSIPLLLLLGFGPITAIGAGLASGIVITLNATLGHGLQGNLPELVPLALIGVPYVSSQLLGWYYVHAVTERVVTYSIAALAALAGLFFLV